MPQTIRLFVSGGAALISLVLVMLTGSACDDEPPPEFGGFFWRRPDQWNPLVEGYVKRLGFNR